MQDNGIGTPSRDAPAPGTAVSPNNPCPFLRALVAGDFVDGHIVPLPKLTGTVQAATGEKGLQAKLAAVKIYLVALVANGLGPLRLLRSWWSGAELDALRDGPLDKHGSGSRILDATAHVNEAELARLAEFGKDRPNPAGGTERGLTAAEIKVYMDANFERAKGARRAIDRKLMDGEFPVLLNVMGKGEGDQRYLSVAEVRTLFMERRLPDRIAGRLPMHAGSSTPAGGPLRKLGKAAIAVLALLVALVVAVAEFPDQVRKVVPSLLAQLLPPTLPVKLAAERPAKFCIGARDFDPEQVGTRVVAGETPSCNKGESLFSTTDSDGNPIHGNSVLGHSLEGAPGPGKPGVIGRMLTEDERFDLIEYLKTL